MKVDRHFDGFSTRVVLVDAQQLLLLRLAVGVLQHHREQLQRVALCDAARRPRARRRDRARATPTRRRRSARRARVRACGARWPRNRSAFRRSRLPSDRRVRTGAGTRGRSHAPDTARRRRSRASTAAASRRRRRTLPGWSGRSALSRDRRPRACTRTSACPADHLFVVSARHSRAGCERAGHARTAHDVHCRDVRLRPDLRVTDGVGPLFGADGACRTAQADARGQRGG